MSYEARPPIFFQPRQLPLAVWQAHGGPKVPPRTPNLLKINELNLKITGLKFLHQLVINVLLTYTSGARCLTSTQRARASRILLGG